MLLKVDVGKIKYLIEVSLIKRISQSNFIKNCPLHDKDLGYKVFPFLLVCKEGVPAFLHKFLIKLADNFLLVC